MSKANTNVQFSPFNQQGPTSCTDSGFKAETFESKNNYNVRQVSHDRDNQSENQLKINMQTMMTSEDQ